jgi:hypothetical protein
LASVIKNSWFFGLYLVIAFLYPCIIKGDHPQLVYYFFSCGAADQLSFLCRY